MQTITESDHQKANFMSETKVNWSFCKLPFWQSSTSSNNSNNAAAEEDEDDDTNQNSKHYGGGLAVAVAVADHFQNSSLKVANSVAKSLLPARRRLGLDPPNKLYFPYEPGKQVKSAIRIKNLSKTRVAFKFQTTEPKSCYMRPPGGILAPDETIIATVFKFVEPPENNEKPDHGLKSKVKFKIMSLKVKDEFGYAPELFDEQKDQVAVEQILRVVFLEPDRQCPAMEKLKRQLAEAEAELEVRKKPIEIKAPKVLGQGPAIDEWVSSFFFPPI
ncbi:OLC1v1025144C2 [Oldenlandia corymbosa var. corymbosa]|uniref:OLC1v1025144C2 n=1 Tax=Oldenlandia corymbosa var. corymbosa TaxID=529605 RepID=A0AAV1C422_OLDCO|nr:OLC1v1025144C2 [Oldenlandia corymbosa var. corymbosa]